MGSSDYECIQWLEVPGFLSAIKKQIEYANKHEVNIRLSGQKLTALPWHAEKSNPRLCRAFRKVEVWFLFPEQI